MIQRRDGQRRVLRDRPTALVLAADGIGCRRPGGAASPDHRYAGCTAVAAVVRMYGCREAPGCIATAAAARMHECRETPNAGDDGCTGCTHAFLHGGQGRRDSSAASWRRADKKRPCTYMPVYIVSTHAQSHLEQAREKGCVLVLIADSYMRMHGCIRRARVGEGFRFDCASVRVCEMTGERYTCAAARVIERRRVEKRVGCVEGVGAPTRKGKRRRRDEAGVGCNARVATMRAGELVREQVAQDAVLYGWELFPWDEGESYCDFIHIAGAEGARAMADT